MAVKVIALSANPDDSIIPNASGKGGATIQVKGATAKCWWSGDQVTAPAQGIDVTAGSIFHVKKNALPSFRATGVGATLVVVFDAGAEEQSATFF